MQLFNRLVVSIIVFLLMIFVGAAAYQQIEAAQRWSYVDSLYFTVITVTTIGYGDLAPQTDIGKIFTIFFSFLGIGMAFYFFSLIGKYIFKKHLVSRLKESGRLRGKKGVRKVSS